MNKTKKLEIEIASLKEQKEDQKFEIEHLMFFFISFAIFLSTLGVTVMLAIEPLWIKLLVVFCFIILLLVLYGFMLPRLWRGKRYNDLCEEIQVKYDKLLKIK